jgi:hypothetical protein
MSTSSQPPKNETPSTGNKPSTSLTSGLSRDQLVEISRLFRTQQISLIEAYRMRCYALGLEEESLRPTLDTMKQFHMDLFEAEERLHQKRRGISMTYRQEALIRFLAINALFDRKKIDREVFDALMKFHKTENIISFMRMGISAATNHLTYDFYLKDHSTERLEIPEMSLTAGVWEAKLTHEEINYLYMSAHISNNQARKLANLLRVTDPWMMERQDDNHFEMRRSTPPTDQTAKETISASQEEIPVVWWDPEGKKYRSLALPRHLLEHPEEYKRDLSEIPIARRPNFWKTTPERIMPGHILEDVFKREREGKQAYGTPEYWKEQLQPENLPNQDHIHMVSTPEEAAEALRERLEKQASTLTSSPSTAGTTSASTPALREPSSSSTSSDLSEQESGPKPSSASLDETPGSSSPQPPETPGSTTSPSS